MHSNSFVLVSEVVCCRRWGGKVGGVGGVVPA